jgi:hypothetical protein
MKKVEERRRLGIWSWALSAPKMEILAKGSGQGYATDRQRNQGIQPGQDME